MKKWLYRIVWIPVLLLAVLFLFANRQPVAVSLDPFSASNPAVTTLPLPLWLWLIVMLFMGVALGAVGMWLSAGDRRARARAEHRELKALRKEFAAAAAEKQAVEEARARQAEAQETADLPKLEHTEP